MGKFKASVMISARLSSTRSIVFDDVTGIPILEPSQMIESDEESFAFDQSNEENISMTPLLEGDDWNFRLYKT